MRDTRQQRGSILVVVTGLHENLVAASSFRAFMNALACQACSEVRASACTLRHASSVGDRTLSVCVQLTFLVLLNAGATRLWQSLAM